MKKRICVISLVLAASMLTSVAASAAVAQDEEPVCIVEKEDRAYTLSDAPSASQIAAGGDYELTLDGEPVLYVENNVPGAVTTSVDTAYFSAKFMLPNTQNEVFIAGLTAQNVQEIQTRIVGSFNENEDFDLEDLSFIDAEKTLDPDDDDELCWAAGCSNILTYTGWAKKASLSGTEDDVYEVFINSFDNNGGNPFYALGWFFNGINYFSQRVDYAASAAPGTGGFLPEYAFDTVSELVDIRSESVKGLTKMCEKLNEGCGVALSLSLYEKVSGEYLNGHTVTCWGYIVDTSKEADDPDRFLRLLIADSDSDEVRGNRRNSPNIITAYSLAWRIDSDNELYYRFHSGPYLAVPNEFTYLIPYNDNIPTETDPDATLDRVSDPDLLIEDAFFGTDFEEENPYDYRMEVIESNTKFYFTPLFRNMSDVLFNDNLVTRISIVRSDGVEVYTRTLSIVAPIRQQFSSISFARSVYQRKGLPAGDYTLSFYVNESHAVREAYYFNNHYSFDFKIRDPFCFGDYDGDGEVTIADATAIQRALAHYSVNVPENADQRGDVNGEGLDITDVTVLQRYLAHYQIAFPVGEKQLYE